MTRYRIIHCRECGERTTSNSLGKAAHNRACIGRIRHRHVIKLPARFYDDHAERALPSGDVLRATKTYVIVGCDDATLAEIESDAKYYADRTGGPDAAPHGLAPSARATVKRIAAYRAAGARHPHGLA